MSRLTDISRRSALKASVTAAAALAAPRLHAASGRGKSPARDVSFDGDWRFFLGDPQAAQAPGFADGTWRAIDLPHDWRIEDLPGGSDDGGATANPSLYAFHTLPSPDGVAPPVIGPFDLNADPKPDVDVTIPGFGRVLMPGGRGQGYTVGNIGWYRKHFKLPVDAATQRVALCFDGVYRNADIWLNGVHLGFHPNGYTSFAYDLTPHLDPSGNNVLAVRVDNRGKPSRWYSRARRWRPRASPPRCGLLPTCAA
ncbi:sugar-binding domain-containing protein [Sphingomonas psychrolutea]|uniref:sugar-binding domain-containing protein n=1 Tax=Sphingomonas psychrolutea TaxID=1259676 RepID=UPI0028040340|nr:sugar-binding domain-containing protein [Sphingomonas psychrolutea]